MEQMTAPPLLAQGLGAAPLPCVCPDPVSWPTLPPFSSDSVHSNTDYL